MLRALALLLLLANALLLAALAGLFGPVTSLGADPREREPERLQRQHQPERMRILGPQAASAALAAAAAAGAQAAAAASSAAALACLQAGPFPAADAAAAERTLRDAGLAPGSWQVQRSDDSGAFMVYMGRYADRATLERKLGEVRRLKLEPDELRDAPALQPGIDLGRFDSQDSANKALAQMAQRGLQTARVITLRQAQSQVLLRVPAADATLRARLAGLQWPSGPGFVACVDGSGAAALMPSATVAGASAASASTTPTTAASATAASPVATSASAPAASAPSAAASRAAPGATR